MMQIDWPTLTNWVVAGLIGAVFGACGAWVTYRLERRRDNIAWERDRKKQLDSFAHESKLLEKGFQQRLTEIEMQFRREDVMKTRQDLLKGIENPLEAVQVLHNAVSEFTGRRSMGLSDSQSKEMELLQGIEKRLAQFLSDLDVPSQED
jgi:hypothetical protein